MSLVKKFLDYAVGNMLALFIGLFTTPIITRIYEPEEMGKYSLFISIMGLALTIFQCGTEQAYSRYYYEEDESKRPQLFQLCVGLPLALLVVFSLLALPFFGPITAYISGERSVNLFVFMFIYCAAYLLNRYTLMLIRMQQKGKYFSLCNILIKLVYVAGAIIFAKLAAPTYMGLVCGITAAYLLVGLLGAVTERKKWMVKYKSYVLDNSMKEILRYSLPFIFSQLIFWAFSSTDKIMINHFADYSQVGIYSGAMSIVNVVVALQTAFGTFWLPVAFERYKNAPEDKAFFENIHAVTVFAMSFVSVGVLVFKGLFSFLLGPSYSESIYILPFLIFMPVMSTISETTVIGINFKKKTKWHIVIAGISAACNIVMNYFAINAWGAKGAAIATGAAYCVYFYLRTVIAGRFYRCNFQIWKFSLSAAALCIGAAYASFNDFDFVTVLLGLGVMALEAALYGKQILKIVKEVRINKQA